jgi:hypothetical protein
VQLCRLEGVQDYVAIFVQLAPGDQKFGEGLQGLSANKGS